MLDFALRMSFNFYDIQIAKTYVLHKNGIPDI